MINQQITQEERIQKMFIKALARPPSPEEIEEISEVFERQVSLHSSGNLPSTEYIYLRSWTDLTHTIFNLKEFIYVF